MVLNLVNTYSPTNLATLKQETGAGLLKVPVAFRAGNQMLKSKYSRTSLFRTRLIRSPRYFEGRSNALGFTLPLYASPVISKPRYFELFFISLGTSKWRGSTVSRIKARVLASKLLHFVSLTDSFIMLDAKLLKPLSCM